MNVNDYYFYNINSLKSDAIDKTQRNIMNNKYSNYYLGNFYPGASSTNDNHVEFATQEPNIFFRGSLNGGIPARSLIDVDSTLLLKTIEERSLEKLDLNPRPFATIPYLGRGSADPTLELQLLQGESSLAPKSVSTIMENSFMPYRELMTDQYMQKRIDTIGNNNSSVLRDGLDTRDFNRDTFNDQQTRPNGGGKY
jgi:hypothetical protein